VIKKLFLGFWRLLTVIRLALANILFIAILAFFWFALTGGPEPLPERAALVLDPSGRVVDERSRVAAASLLFESSAADSEVLLADLIDSVELAIDDSRIVALVLDLDELISIGQSKTSELAGVLARFRATGKPLVARGDYFTQDQYRLAVEADRLLMHPFGAVALEGYSVYVNYLTDALEKLSLSVHVFRAGEFKSIAEPFLRRDMSPAEREITRAWLDDNWNAYVEAVEERRGLPEGTLDTLLNDFAARLRASNGNAASLAQELGLVDELLDREQQNAYLSALVGASDDEGHYAAVSYRDYLPRVRQRGLDPSLEKVAIVTAQGNILPGDQPPGSIGADSLVRLLKHAQEREGTRAIVLRVTSGGGSVFASELIRAELARIRDTGMPVVVSMGSVAASGGYYIATAADRIFATPTTITGSIGVFAAFPTAERLFEKGGIYTDGVGTTPLAGGLRPDRALAPEIADSLQQSVDNMYEQFLGLVMASRGLDRETLNGLAEGRVLSAPDALAGGLIDGLGGLDEAVSQAAELAGLGPDRYEAIMIQPAYSPREMLLQELSDNLGLSSKLGLGRSLPASGLAHWFVPLRQGVELLDSFVDPGHLYMRCVVCLP
jgi:protease-4